MVTRIMFVLHLAVENRRVSFARPESFFDEQPVGMLHVSPALRESITPGLLWATSAKICRSGTVLKWPQSVKSSIGD